MALTNPQGKLILINDSSKRIEFDVTDNNLITTGSSLDPEFATLNLEAYWDFEGNMIDSNLNNIGRNDGAISEGVEAYDTGANGIGQLFDFDGASSINPGTDASLHPTSEISIDFWAEWTTGAGGANVFNFGLGIYLVANESAIADRRDFRSDNIGGSGKSIFFTDGAFPTTNMTYYCLTYDGTTMKMFANKVLKATAAASGSIGYPNANNRIGSRPDDAANWAGQLDHLRLYSRALTDGGAVSLDDVATGEIAQNYTAGGGV